MKNKKLNKLAYLIDDNYFEKQLQVRRFKCPNKKCNARKCWYYPSIKAVSCKVCGKEWMR